MRDGKRVPGRVWIGALACAVTVACSGGGGGRAGADTGFVLESADTSFVTAAGGVVDATIAISEVAAAEPVTFAASELPAGLTVAFDPPTVIGNGTVTVTVTVGTDAPPGTHTFSVLASAGGSGGEQSLEMTVVVASGPVPDTLTLVVPIRTAVRQTASTAVQIEVARGAGVTGEATLELSGVPPGMTAYFDQNPTPEAAGLLRIGADASVAAGVYPILATARVDGRDASAILPVEVVELADEFDRWVSRVEIGQSYLGSGVALVAEKPAVVRAHVLADQPGLDSPAVVLTATREGVELGELTLVGPTILPIGEDPASLASSFCAELPWDWVVDGLELDVALEGGAEVVDRDPDNDTGRVLPTVVRAAELHVVLVPLLLDGRIGSALDCADALWARFPVREVQVTIRDPYEVQSVKTVGSDGQGWSDLLGEVASLRLNDGSDAYYYGLVDVDYVFGFSGIGYVGYSTAVGRDDSIRTLLHELGHNFGLRHAPCGGADDPDPDYPFPWGLCGSQGYDLRSGVLRPPTRTDLMGYCSSTWISSYHYEKARAALNPAPEPQPIGVGLAQSPGDTGDAGAGAEIALLTVRGSIAADGSIDVVSARRIGRLPAGPSRGAWTLQAEFEGGAGVASRRFDAHGVGRCAGLGRARDFAVTVPDLGDLAAIEIRDGERLCGRIDAGSRPGQAHAVRWSERGGALTVDWNAGAWSDLSVVHVGASRTTVGLGLRGGHAELSTTRLPRGGAWEFAVTTGLHGECFRAPR